MILAADVMKMKGKGKGALGRKAINLNSERLFLESSFSLINTLKLFVKLSCSSMLNALDLFLSIIMFLGEEILV